MPGKTISYEGLDELIQSLERMDDTIDREGRKFLRDLSIYGVKQAQIHILEIGAVDTNELIQGIHYDLSGYGINLESVIKPSDKADAYAAAIEDGTAPHWVPIAALEGWASRHGISPYAVQRKIAREGTEARPYWQPTFDDLEAETDREIPNFLDNLLRGF